MKECRMRMPETAVEVTEADDGDLFLRVLDQALDALDRAEIPFLLIGGIGSAVYGRDQGTRDIDVFIRPETARKVLDVLRERGFETKEVAERWLSKAIKHGVLVDVIFRSSRDILLGDQMFERARQHGARRLLSLLLFATSLDIVVPSEPIETLHQAIGTGRPA